MISQHKILTHLARLYEEEVQPITTKTYKLINAENMKKAHAAVLIIAFIQTLM